MKSISDRLGEPAILLLDGAMGTELFRRGVSTQLPSWSAAALIENPQMIREIHEDNIRAGAEVITANTFRTTTRALGKVGLNQRAKELTFLAVDLAKQARNNAARNPVWIAGSVAPLEDCYEPELMPDPETALAEHTELIHWLLEAGVDLILIETMNTITETIAATRAAQSNKIPMFVSWTCGPAGNILNGESIQTGVRSVEPFKPSALLVNCTPAKEISAALRALRDSARDSATVRIGAYANIGKPEPVSGWEFTNDLDPSAYANEAQQWIQQGATIVGGCCGTTPEHISALKKLIEFGIKRITKQI